MKILILIFLCLLPPIPGFCVNFDKAPKQAIELSSATKQEENTRALLSLLHLEKSIKNRIKARETQLNKEDSANEQERIKDEIGGLGKQFSKATADFERLATGVDPATFSEKRKDIFSWQEELISLLRPALRELQNITINAREKTTLQTDIAHHEKLQPVAENALGNLQHHIATTNNPVLKQKLGQLLPEWNNINEQLDSKLEVLRIELKSLELQDKPFVDGMLESTGHFFKNRGFYLILALAIFFLTLLCFSLVRNAIRKHIPAYHQKDRSFLVRLSAILFRALGLIIASLTLFIVFYIVQDWTLLSLLIIFFIAVLWTFRVMIPKYWLQGEILLNIGPVREGERIMLHGVPWLIKNINMYTALENPDLQISLRLPVQELVGNYSRQFDPDEPWFPCRKNDWLILSDKSFGKVITLSHESITLLERGGSRKTYQTSHFLSLAPKNLSTNFRIKSIFGVSYRHQHIVTSQLPSLLLNFLQEQFILEGYAEQLLDLQVTFNQMGASSLDLVVIADFKGTAASLYNRLHRNIQRYCVEASTANNWEIPFPQLTIHNNQTNN